MWWPAAVLEDGPGSRLRRSPGPLGPGCSPGLLCQGCGIVLFNAPALALEKIRPVWDLKIKFSADDSSMSLMRCSKSQFGWQSTPSARPQTVVRSAGCSPLQKPKKLRFLPLQNERCKHVWPRLAPQTLPTFHESAQAPLSATMRPHRQKERRTWRSRWHVCSIAESSFLVLRLLFGSVPLHYETLPGLMR